MNLKYIIYGHRKLLVDVLSGPIKSSNLYQLHNAYMKDEKIHLVKTILTNVSKADFKLTLDEMLAYIEVLKKETLHPDLKWAILTETPNSTMFSILIKEEPYFKGKVGVFSTLAASTEFLNIDFTEKNFNDDQFKILD